LIFRQKLVPFDLRLTKASGSKIEGANEFSGGALQLTQGGQAVPNEVLPGVLDDFFATAQFLDMSQDDRLAKPSFEQYGAGYELGDDQFEIGEVLAETLNYEEADLGASRTKLNRMAIVAYASAKHGALLRFGAAGRSDLRDRALTQPAQSTVIRVDPAPVLVAAKTTLTAIAGAGTYRSVWRAEQARMSSVAMPVSSLAVVELAETV
jgi:hypothetical protein